MCPLNPGTEALSHCSGLRLKEVLAESSVLSCHGSGLNNEFSVSCKIEEKKTFLLKQIKGSHIYEATETKRLNQTRNKSCIFLICFFLVRTMVVLSSNDSNTHVKQLTKLVRVVVGPQLLYRKLTSNHCAQDRNIPNNLR